MTVNPLQARFVTILQHINKRVITLRATGQVTIRLRDGKKLQHEGIKVEFVGSIGE
jgi:hypothetical protein